MILEIWISRWNLESSWAIMALSFHQHTLRSLLSSFFHYNFSLLPSLYQISLCFWPWVFQDELLNLPVPNPIIIEMMQEVRSQLEIQLQEWNSELQAYNKPKETFPEKNPTNTHTWKLLFCQWSGGCQSLLQLAKLWQQAERWRATRARTLRALATGYFNCNPLE